MGASRNRDILQGTLDLMVLQDASNAMGPLHGYGCRAAPSSRYQRRRACSSIRGRSTAFPSFACSSGGGIAGGVGAYVGENNRKAKFYTINQGAGRRQFVGPRKTEHWERIAGVIGRPPPPRRPR